MVGTYKKDADKLFTFHIVNIKRSVATFEMYWPSIFTFHIVNIKPQNKLSISNTYTYTILLNLQWASNSAIDNSYHTLSTLYISTIKPYFITKIAHCKTFIFLLYHKTHTIK